jgi:hypothetical protein
VSPKEFKEKMLEIFPLTGYDEEAAHGDADMLMCELLSELGYEDGVKIFETSDRWYA